MNPLANLEFVDINRLSSSDWKLWRPSYEFEWWEGIHLSLGHGSRQGYRGVSNVSACLPLGSASEPPLLVPGMLPTWTHAWLHILLRQYGGPTLGGPLERARVNTVDASPHMTSSDISTVQNLLYPAAIRIYHHGLIVYPKIFPRRRT